MSRGECPTNTTLERLCDGLVSADQEEEIYAHVDDCVTCQQSLDRLTDTKKNGIRTLNADPSQESETLAKRLDDLKSQGRPQKLSGSRLFKDLSPWFDAAVDSEGAIGRIDEYELLECVGRGGMGIVFRARDSKLTRDVALKVMSPSLLADTAATGRFLREAQSAAKINHANVVTLFAVSEVKELPYIAMEYVKGESLQELLDRQGKLDVDDAIAVAKQITAGLAAAHDAGVVHRDMKPANVLIDSSSGNVKLTDFGLARSLDGTQFTASGFLVGTPEFAAPEQIDSGQPVDHRADLFSLGSVLYRLVTDRTPFASESTLNTLTRICRTEPQDVCSLNENVPQWLGELIHQLLAKDPGDRPENAKAVSRVLHERSLNTLPHRSRESRVLLQDEAQSSPTTPVVSKRMAAVATIGVITFLSAFVWRMWWDNQPVRIATAEELVRYYDYSSDDDDLSIVLTSDQPYLVEPFLIEGRNLVLTGARGIKPRLVFELDEPHTCIEVIDGTLEMSGIAIETNLSNDSDHDTLGDDEDDDIVDNDGSFADPSGDEAAEEFEIDSEDRIGVINCEHGSITLTDCRILSQDSACIRAEGTSCEFDSCDFKAIGDACLVIDSTSEDVVTLTNCLLVGEANIYLCCSIDLAVELTNNTFIGDASFSLNEIDPERAGLSILAVRNVFDASEALFRFDDDDSFAMHVIEEGELRWEGEANLYAGPFISARDGLPLSTLRNLAEWRELTDSSEAESKHSVVEFGIDESNVRKEIITMDFDRNDLVFDSDEGYGIQNDLEE